MRLDSYEYALVQRTSILRTQSSSRSGSVGSPNSSSAGDQGVVAVGQCPGGGKDLDVIGAIGHKRRLPFEDIVWPAPVAEMFLLQRVEARA